MSVIVRTATGNYVGVPDSWDRNRVDLDLVPNQAIQALGSAICTFIPIGGPGPRPLIIANTLDYRTDAKRKIEKAIAERKARFLSTWNDETGRLSIARTRAEAAQTRLNQARATGVGVAAAQANKAAADAYHADYINLFNTIKASLDTLSWPVVTPNKLHVRFSFQTTCSAGTGFAIHPQYVMTAGHVLNEVKAWTRYMVHFNFRAAPPLMPAPTTAGPFDQEYGRNVMRHTDGHEIKRVVLRALSTTPLNAFNVVNVHDSDMAIFELKHAPLVPFPQTTLTLASVPPPLNTEVFAIGHPQGVPLKYVAFEPTATTRPQITATPLPATPRGHHSCVTADLDKHGGMSGGPLFRRDTTEVVGVGRSGPMSSTRPNPPIDVLQTELLTWFNDVFTRQHAVETRARPAGAPPMPPPALLTAAGLPLNTVTDFKDWRYHRAYDRFTLLQYLPNDADVIQKNAWNRTDIYQPFTRPLREFLTAGRSIKIELSLTVQSSMFLGGISPALAFDGQNPVVFCDRIGAITAQTNQFPHVFEYKWQRDLTAATDLDAGQAPWNDNLQRGQLHGDGFVSPHGLCGWSEVDITFDPGFFAQPLFDYIVTIDGQISVSFAYEHGNNNINASVFENNLVFAQGTNAQHWKCLLGEHATTTYTQQGNRYVPSHVTEGQPWSGPTWVNLPLAQRPVGQDAVANAVANVQAILTNPNP